MMVLFAHAKNPFKNVLYSVPEPLLPTFRIPFPIELVDLDEVAISRREIGITMGGKEVRIAEFILQKVKVFPEGDVVPIYIFDEWI